MSNNDHFARFQQSLDAANAMRKPTRESRQDKFAEEFRPIIDAINTMNDMLMERQPHSTVSYTCPEYNSEDDQLVVQIRGSKASGVNSILVFIYQNGRIYARTTDFKQGLGDHPPQWSATEAADLVPRITDYYGRFFVQS